MNKAEERAKEAYPLRDAEHVYDEERVIEARGYFIEGYHQAEKDLELTWEDIESIHTLMAHQEVAPILWKCGNEAFYQEVLKRFKSYGKKEI